MPEGLLEAQRKKSEAEVLGPEQVRGLFQLWNNALATLDPEQVAARYSKNAILLPTVSDTPRTTKESITDYFGKSFCMRRSKVDHSVSLQNVPCVVSL